MLEFALSNVSGFATITVDGSTLNPVEGTMPAPDGNPHLVAYAGLAGLTALSTYTALIAPTPSSDGEFTATATVTINGVSNMAQSLYIDWDPTFTGPYGVAIYRVAIVVVVPPYKAQPSTVRSFFS